VQAGKKIEQYNMPSYPPRSEAVKKQDQLTQREAELRHIIQVKSSSEKLTKAVKKYRDAQLSLLKAQLHIIQDKHFQERPHNFRIGKIESNINIWTNKSDEEIISDFI
jgi:hypothetical protein